MSFGFLKMLSTNYSFTNHIYYMYKQDLVSNNLQELIRHKTQLTPKYIHSFKNRPQKNCKF